MWATWEQGLSLFARRIDLGTQVINEYWWKGGGERRSNRTLQRSQKGPSRRQGVLLLEILLTRVRHPMRTRHLKGLYEPWESTYTVWMSGKRRTEWRQDSPFFHLGPKSHDMVLAGPYPAKCLSPLEEGLRLANLHLFELLAKWIIEFSMAWEKHGL